MLRPFAIALPLLVTTVSLACAGPLIVGHRGASGVAPENTLAAFKKAFEEGADAIEGDFYLTKDGKVVCIHDADTKRTAGGVSKQVRQSTLEDLRALDVGAWKGESYKGEKIPTLREVLAVLKPGKRLFLEVKCGPEILDALFADIAASGVNSDQVTIISFNEDVIRQVKTREPDFKAYWLVSIKAKADGSPEPAPTVVVEKLTRLSADGAGVEADPTIDARFVKAVKDAGFHYNVWTIDSPEVAKRFVAYGVDSVTTDVPGPLRAEIEGRH